MKISTRGFSALVAGWLVGGMVLSTAGMSGAVSFSTLKTKAEAGDVLSQYSLGEKLYRGDGVKQDVEAAAKWFEQAATNGLPDAQFMMGVLSEQGAGVKPDQTAATGWYRKAGEQNHASAAFIMGKRCAEGSGVNKDEAEAAQWFLRAAELGDVSAEYTIGSRYAAGLGVKNDFGEAARWYRKAAEKGDASAQFSLAMLYADGHAMPPAGETPLTWFRKAAEQNHLTAQYCLGYRLAHGDGGRSAEKEGVRWLSRAANAGDASAQFELGALYAKGVGVKQSQTEALKWFLVAAALGNGSTSKLADESTKELKADDVAVVRRDAQEIIARLKPGTEVVTPKPSVPAEVVKETPKPSVEKPAATEVKPALQNEAPVPAPKKSSAAKVETEVSASETKSAATDYQAALKLAEGHLQSQRTNETLKVLVHVLDSRLAEKDAGALSRIAALSAAAGASSERERALERLVKLEPKNPDAWYDLAVARATLHKEPESLMALKTALTLGRKRLSRDDKARDILIAARKEECFDAFRDSSAFKKLLSAQ